MAWNTSGWAMIASLLLCGCVAGVSEVRHSEVGPDKPHHTSHGFRALGFARVHELDWGEHVDVAGLRFFAHSAVHESGRGVSDENRTLWATWVISTGRRTVLFAGDNGYSSTIFPRIGESHAKVDLAIVPIGAYAPRASQGATHVTPEEAVRIGVDVNARRLLASHWGTFSLGDEPPVRFRAAAHAAGYSDRQAWVLRIGETRRW